jgi:hypothetical protein
MLIRAIALSLALLLGVGTIIPFMTDSTEAGPRQKKKKKKKLKKYSRAWWRWYKKEQRKKRAILARKRALRAKRILLARKKAQRPKTARVRTVSKKRTPKVAGKNSSRGAILPSGKKAPDSFQQSQATNSELQFRVSDDNGGQIGIASLSVVGPARAQ